MQRGEAGCAAEALPAAETAEAEQGQPSKYTSGPRPAPYIWLTATRSSAPIFTRAHRRPQGKLAKRKRTAAAGGRGHRYGRWAAQPRRCLRQKQPRRSRGKHSDRILWMKQGAVFGAALRFLQAPSAVRRKNRLSARGMRSVFCKRAPPRAAYLGNGNPEGLDHKSNHQAPAQAKAPPPGGFG